MLVGSLVGETRLPKHNTRKSKLGLSKVVSLMSGKQKIQTDLSPGGCFGLLDLISDVRFPLGNLQIGLF